MGLDQFLHLYVGHLSAIIEGLFVSILAFVSIYLVRALKADATGEATQIEKLEQSLKKVLEQTQASQIKSAHVSADAVSLENVEGSVDGAAEEPGSQTALVQTEEQEKLVTEMNAKIQALQEALEKAKAGAPTGAPSKEAEAKIKELEAKLADYEIISDDIANLTLYKQENARLKDEITRVKADPTAVAATPVDPQAQAKVAEEAKAEAERVAKEKAAAVPKPVEELVMRVGVDASEIKGKKPGDLNPDVTANPTFSRPAVSAEADEAVAKKAAAAAGQASSAPIADPLAASLVAALADQNPAPVSPTDDIMAEFEDIAAQSAEAKAAAAASETVPGSVAQATTPAPTPVADVPAAPAPQAAAPETPAAGPSALKVEIDPDKMVTEMAQFAETKPTTPTQAPGDESTQLIQEFENFMKSS